MGNPLSPIQIISPSQRLTNFTSNSDSIYNKFSPYDASGAGISIGFQQPYVWVKPNDSSLSMELTSFDNQAIHLGSSVRDLERMGKFLASGTGLMFIGKQFLLQQQAAFNETRVYNPLEIIASVESLGSTGLVDAPTRYLAGNGIGNYAASALNSILGSKILSVNTDVSGVASAPISSYAKTSMASHPSDSATENAKGKGLLHLQTGQAATNRFQTYFGTAVSGKGNSLFQSLITKFMPSTQALGFGSTATSAWTFRPEYPDGKPGVYYIFLNDANGILREYSADGLVTYDASDFHKYSPHYSSDDAFEIDDKTRWYTGSLSMTKQFRAAQNVSDQISILNLGIDSIDPESFNGFNIPAWNVSTTWSTIPQLRRSTEVLPEVSDYGQNEGLQFGTYADIPTGGSTANYFTKKLTDPLTLDARGFSKQTSRRQYAFNDADTYNILEPFSDIRYSDGHAPDKLMLNGGDSYNSGDIVFFYFYDLVNSVYIPFRATVSGLNDQHSVDWDEVSYIGRADKLFVYKGFTRDVNFTFTVYANSLRELLPMWERINYLIGLARPSKYTTKAGITTQFMYPPMTTFRLGDVFVDQPCVMKSVNLTVPDDATWETQRGYDYTFLRGYLGSTKFDSSNINLQSLASGSVDSVRPPYDNSKKFIYQLPKKVDISINMAIMEKERSITYDSTSPNSHYYVLQSNK